MQKREYIIDATNINTLADFVVIFAGFSIINKKESPKIVYDTDIDLWIKERLWDDDNLNRYIDYIRTLVTPMDNSIWVDDHILIRILNSEHLKQILWREYTEKYIENIIKYLEEKSLVELWWKNFTEEERKKRIEFQYLKLKALKWYVRNLTIFDELMLNILEVKKVRLQLE